jgi:hypothetical protein
MQFWQKYKKYFFILFLLIIFAFAMWQLWKPIIQPETEPSPPSLEDIISGLPEAGPGGPGTEIRDPDQLQPTGPIADPRFPGQEVVDGPEQADPIAIGGITKTELIVNRPTFSPTLDQNGNMAYYDLRDSKFYKMDENGNIIPLSDKVFNQVTKVDWAPNADKAVIHYPDGNKTIYNFDTEKQVTLPKHWDDFSFSPNGNHLSGKSLADNPDNRWLIVFSDDGTGARALEPLGDNYDKIYPSWSPNNQSVAMWTDGIDFNRQKLIFLGLNDENFKSTVIEGRGFEPLWSKEGDKLLYSVYNDNNNMNPKVWVVDAIGNEIGQNRTNLGLDTWASKCTFAGNDDVYCAVPDYLPEGSGLFPEAANDSVDSLYHINLKTGSKQMVATPENNVNISQVMVSPDQTKLYFTDRRNGQVYQINLK